MKRRTLQFRQSRFGYRFCKIKREATQPHKPTQGCFTFYFTPTLPLFVSFLLFCSSTFGQINLPQTPQPATLQRIDISPQNNSNKPTPPTNSNNGVKMYEQDLARQKQQREQLREALNEVDADFNKTIYYELPSCTNKQGAEFYRQAFSKLQKIIQSDTLSLKQAIFTVENAFFENKMNSATFDNYLKDCIQICNWKLKKDKHKQDNQLAKVLTLFQFFSDTIEYKDAKTKQWKIHYPLTYDFSDWEGKEDYSKMFVTKLMATQTGQCHSMPLLFLILAQEWNIEAYLSFSPRHSFVRFKDNSGKLYNMELTNGMLTSDAFINGSGYVTAEALKNKIYLDTLSNKKIIAQCFADLAQGYTAKYCYDKFALQCTNESIKYYQNNIFAQQLKSDYYTIQFDYVIKQLGKPPLKDLPKYPEAYDIYKKRNLLYDLVDNLGFQEMPAAAYENWLKSVNDEKNKRENQNLIINLKQSIENK